jgi:UDPglucose--hexose-1-phosphate uridylyltransferase
VSPRHPTRRRGRRTPGPDPLSSPEIRIDQLTGLRTVLAPGRAERPDAFAPTPPESKPDAAARCPFCEGREDRTPPEVWADRPGGGGSDTPGWRVRSVPNLYPVLGAPEGDVPPPAESGLASSVDPLRATARGAEPDLFSSQPATGAHEVIVSAPEHFTSLAQLGEEQLGFAIDGWRERMRAHRDAAYLHLIVNEGPEAGASLEHSHAQLYALGFVPAEVARERERAGAYHERTLGSHLLGDVAVEEIRRRERLVAIDDGALLICPWASRSPFELRVIPRRPAPRFEEDSAGTGMIATALGALAGALGSLPQLNLWVRTAPRGAGEFCWHVDVLPQLTTRAGFELGTGVEINVYPPERAAADLREALE